MNKRMAWYRWEKPDPFQKDKWTAFTVSIHEPTYDYPSVCVIVTIANGKGKVFFRCLSLIEAKRYIVIPDIALERLELAVTRGIGLAEDIRRDLRIIADVQSLSPGAQIIRTDTGEIIAEAERIIKEDYDAKET